MNCISNCVFVRKLTCAWKPHTLAHAQQSPACAPQTHPGDDNDDDDGLKHIFCHDGIDDVTLSFLAISGG